ncbi:hypothetical protein D1Z30_11700 [Enterococcus faecalis]|nr:hypothetical protein [Enterococcus faecalis]
MSYAVRIYLEDEFIKYSQILWNDSYQIDMIQKNIGASSVEAESLTDSIDAWVDDVGGFQKGNFIVGINVNDKEYKFAGNLLLIGLDMETGKSRGLTQQEIDWISCNVKIWRKPIGFL